METISINGNLINYISFQDLKNKVNNLGLKLPKCILDRYNIKPEKIKVLPSLPNIQPNVDNTIIFEDIKINSNSYIIKQYNLWLLMPGNENKTLQDYISWIKQTGQIDNTWTSTNW